MSVNSLRIFRLFLIGAITSLAIWFAFTWVFDTDPFDTSPFHLAHIFIMFLPFGAVLGVLVAVLEQQQASGLRNALRGRWHLILVGLAIGGVGAVGGGYFGELIFSGMKNASALVAFLGRTLGMVVVGLFIGISFGIIEKVQTGSMERFLYGCLGGVVGGFFSGLGFHALAVLDPNPMYSGISYLLLGGMLIAGLFSVTQIFSKAFLLGNPKNYSPKYRASFQRALPSDKECLLGSGLPAKSSGKTDFKIVWDDRIDRIHARIYCQHKRWYLERYEDFGEETWVNGKQISHRVELHPGDEIKFGKTVFTLRLER